jgi:hypothetical protein
VGQRVMSREQVERARRARICRGTKRVRAGGIAWLTGAVWLEHAGRNQAIGLVRALGGSGSGREMNWHESRAQVSERERYARGHFDTLRHGRRGTADAKATNEKIKHTVWAWFRRGAGGLESELLACGTA